MSTEGFGPRLGTRVSSMTADLRAFFGAPKDAGLLVQGIEPGSAAEGAKLKVGDVLVEVDGQRIEQVADVRRALSDRSEGDVVEVEVIRKKKRKTLRATITSADDDSFSFSWPSESDLELTLPPDVQRHLAPRTREQIQRQLDQAREQLRRVERMLEALEQSGDAPEAPRSKDEGKRGKSKSKSKSKTKTKTKGKTKPVKKIETTA